MTLQRTCDGQGACRAASTLPCAPYGCDGTSACKATCTADADCLAPSICDLQTNLCGDKKRLGQPCSNSAECLTGNVCVDGVCCASSSCGLCRACAVPGSAGSCTPVPAGSAEPGGGCAPSLPCGNTGNCTGAGTCEQAASSVSCGAASCTGASYTPPSHCTGAGTCAAPIAASCSPYVCGANACKTGCVLAADCVAPFTCQGAGATRSCALKANRLACVGDGECISGSCVDGVCCGSTSCPACQACNLSGTGTCAPVAGGIVCAAASCPPLTETFTPPALCDGAGGCVSGVPASCGAYSCKDDGSACKAMCLTLMDCAPLYDCQADFTCAL